MSSSLFRPDQIAGVVFGLLLFAFSSPGFADDASRSQPIADAAFSSAGIGPIEVAPAMGDMGKDGVHGNYVRIPGKFSSPPHVHTMDYFGVVVAGTVANGAEGSVDIPLAVGSYWFQKGNERHVTKCLSEVPCVFFVVQQGKFDFLVE